MAPRAHPAFPELLYRMVTDAEENNNQHIVRFTTDGEAFLILDREALIRDLAPQYFRFHSMASFRRQLCLYGFVKCTREGKSGYTHDLFRRGRQELLVGIRRTYSSNDKNKNKT